MPRIDARFVILNEVKNPLEADKQQRTQRIANEEILRFTQDDKQYVILNEVKNPLRADKQQRTKCIASEEVLRFTQDDGKLHAQDDRVAVSGKSL